MGQQSTTDILDACLAMLDQGKGIEDCMLAYPDHAGLLDASLRAAQTLRNSRAAVDASIPAPSYRRDLILGTAAQASVAPLTPVSGATGGGGGFFSGFRRLAAVPYALPALAAMVILGGAALGVSAATGGPTSPGWFSSSASHDNRIDVRGTITAISPEGITVATVNGDVTAQITPDTEFEGLNDAPAALSDFVVGDFVKLSTLPAPDGSLVAREIEHENEPGENQAEATPASTEQHDDDDDGDNSGPGNTNDDDHSGPGGDDEDDDRSGPGDGTDDEDDEHSGPGGGEVDDDDERDDHSGSSGHGSGGDDDEPDDDDHSGPGGGDR